MYDVITWMYVYCFIMCIASYLPRMNFSFDLTNSLLMTVKIIRITNNSSKRLVKSIGVIAKGKRKCL